MDNEIIPIAIKAHLVWSSIEGFDRPGNVKRYDVAFAKDGPSATLATIQCTNISHHDALDVLVKLAKMPQDEATALLDLAVQAAR